MSLIEREAHMDLYSAIDDFMSLARELAHRIPHYESTYAFSVPAKAEVVESLLEHNVAISVEVISVLVFEVSEMIENVRERSAFSEYRLVEIVKSFEAFKDMVDALA